METGDVTLFRQIMDDLDALATAEAMMDRGIEKERPSTRTENSRYVQDARLAQEEQNEFLRERIRASVLMKKKKGKTKWV